MNIKNNKSLSELKFVDKLYVPPSGSDRSLSIGACYHLAKMNPKPLENIYLGYDLNDENIKNQIKKKFSKKNYQIHENFNHKSIAKLLKNNEIVACAREEKNLVLVHLEIEVFWQVHKI